MLLDFFNQILGTAVFELYDGCTCTFYNEALLAACLQGSLLPVRRAAIGHPGQPTTVRVRPVY